MSGPLNLAIIKKTIACYAFKNIDYGLLLTYTNIILIYLSLHNNSKILILGMYIRHSLTETFFKSIELHKL